MSIDFVNRAIQIPSSSGYAVQEILTHSAHLLGRIGRAVGNNLTDALPQSLVGRAVLLTVIGLPFATFIAHYKAQPSQSSDRNNSLLSYSLKMPVLFIIQALVGDNNLLLPAFFIDSLVQFKTALLRK